MCNAAHVADNPLAAVVAALRLLLALHQLQAEVVAAHRLRPKLST